MRVLIKTSLEDKVSDLIGEAIKNSKDSEFHVSLSKTVDSNYDIGISYMFHHKISKEHLEKPWFNFHPAPLPEYKGRNLCYHAIINGETEFGATLHYMDEDYDTGDIIKVRKFAIEHWMTAQDLSDLAQACAWSLFTEYLPRIIAGEQFERTPNVGGYYYPKTDIQNEIVLSDEAMTRIRAITYKEFLPSANVNGVWYNIVRAG